MVTVAAESVLPAGSALRDHVAIVGGGASGTLTALHLLRSDPAVRVTVAEPSGRLGCGVAYGTTDPRHLLNVRAGNMSALPDRPHDLLSWAAERGRPLDPDDFLPRREYGAYLRERLDQVAGQRLRVVPAAVADVVPTHGGFEVRTAGEDVVAGSVVLAHGNQAPRRLEVAGTPVPDAAWHVTDPWGPGWLEELAPDATVVLVGTGLTAIDTAISVLDDAPGRRVCMVSRHGLLPRAHIDCHCVAWVSPVPDGPLTADQLAALFAEQVAAAAEHGVSWHHVVDGLRGPTQGIWARLPLEERRRFLAEHARAWEVRRHRMSAQVAARLHALAATGRLRVSGGGITGIEEAAPYPLVRLGQETVRAHAVVNCTGPQTDVTRSTNPLLRRLLERGLVAPDPLRLGLSCTAEGEVLDAADRIVPGLLTVGPPRKGTLFETTAIPEIRVQAAEVATRSRGRAA